MIRAVLTALMLALALGTQAPAETRVPQSQAEISLGFAPLVKQAAPAVVNIYAKIVTEAPQASPFAGDPFFDDFFRSFSNPRPRVQNSLGSGVILAEDGIVVSNYHVVGMATEIRVVTTDRHEYDARVVLADQASDLAILRLEDAEGLPFLNLRNSDQVEVGELALAIGNPFGVGQTVSSGIISGLARTGTGTGEGFGYYIQTDAPINPGNSGGALIDVNGELIGINTRILSRSGGSNGIGFAIPANLVREFLHQARAGAESFQRPWAGMTGQPVDADLAASLGMPRPEGMLISELHPESPFAKAGFEVGDVVIEVDGEPVNSPSEMVFRMTIAGLGGSSDVARWRGGEKKVVRVEMYSAPDNPAADPVQLGERSPLPGLTVARINPRLIVDLQLPLTAEGVVIADPGPYGARAGLQRGDVLLGINGEAVTTPQDVVDLMGRTQGWLVIDLLRRGQRVSLRFRL
ncbi:trypsin-like peptidase domain-containing protein [Phaeobacter gallaeciensis]|uniref:trypsin-like peptidase domain-containing protein n=1 Tax=Phaeobacter gallaeciensis TaxID=60890 RepID=UPI002380702E|nr:trypsin-like peptidase domain-containing protein [Phaeobacter gallaeciensis]MDE4276572.1 trypsin-like peptidase domain-containing protein [Phaeobacter gallaeciensis]MDE4301792.1 trypsin-like peptidase domain-containing protein [Phaeobacter gallaeciensis]MDE5186955.1 trypsin-like peptidase domain-containing protein [Phaeobacter gallaeciensis]